MDKCDLCQADNGVYDFGRDCCLVRFLMHVPTKMMRAGYLDWWMHKYGEERIAKVKELVKQAWAENLLGKK